MTCPHCHREIHIEPGQRGCQECLSVRERCKTEPFFYDAIQKNYLDVPFVALLAKVIIFDLNGVADLFPVQEFVEMVRPFLGTAEVVILSYVGSTTVTRQTAQDFIDEMNAIEPTIRAFLCFRRHGVSDKGSFVSQIGGVFNEVLFFDDHKRNINSVKKACSELEVACEAVLVPPRDKKIITDRLS